MKSPLFSCVVPVKGARPYLAEALSSLKAQGMGDELEVIVQDGDVETDLGQSDALNKGFAKARGEWLFWLNADDLLLPNALRRIKESGADDVGWIAGNVVYIDADDIVKWCAWDRGAKLAYCGLPVQVYGPSSFFRRSLFEKAGGFDISLSYSMDVDLWCKFRQLGYWYKKVPDFVWGFRLHDGSKTSGAQQGRWSPEHVAEQEIISARYGLHGRLGAGSLARLVRMADGSYLKAWLATLRMKGKSIETLQMI